MSTPTSITATDVAKGLNIFEIDESLAALVEAAQEEAEANNGELSESIQEALSTYAEAFGYKVDRIANFLKAQAAEAEISKRESLLGIEGLSTRLGKDIESAVLAECYRLPDQVRSLLG